MLNLETKNHFILEPSSPSVAQKETPNPEAYRNLIGVLLTYPHKTAEILEANQELVDAVLLQMMERVAAQMSENGSQKAADLLRDRSQQLKQEVVIDPPQTPPTADDGFNVKDLLDPDEELPKSKPRFRWAMFLAVPLILLVLGTLGVPLYNSFKAQSSARNVPVTPKPSVPVNKNVAALGRIQPKDKVISVSGSSSLQHARVAQILVNEGDKVRRGQLIAILDNLNQLQANLEQAKLDVRVAQAELAKTKAGESKQGEIAAQKAVIADLNAQFRGQVATQKAKVASLKAELANARTDRSRFELLYKEGAISASEFDSKNLKVTTLQQQLNEAQANLNQTTSSFPEQIAGATADLKALQEVRPVDVQVAQTQLEKAIAAVPKAEADLDLAYVRAPVDGQILTIHTFAGENISDEGIVDLAQTQQMYVVAEVYETDIGKIRVGQKATISSPALPRNFKGTVEKIGLEVGKKEVINSDPTLDLDARVVNVRIRLDSADTQQAARLIDLQVDVKISIN
ncbi:MAG: ABC exporter membrane fusion protein [Hydrococcus sp. Prado102]|jgi:HlyD family secretion protein|nr:ABC exporter membrane fusion protein [Hydrococcus sp. Prado102]